jgi:hypothetical protein
MSWRWADQDDRFGSRYSEFGWGARIVDEDGLVHCFGGEAVGVFLCILTMDESGWRKQIAWPLLEKQCFDFRWTKHVTGAETVWCCCVNEILWGWWSVLGMTVAYGKAESNGTRLSREVCFSRAKNWPRDKCCPQSCKYLHLNFSWACNLVMGLFSHGPGQRSAWP